MLSEQTNQAITSFKMTSAQVSALRSGKAKISTHLVKWSVTTSMCGDFLSWILEVAPQSLWLSDLVVPPLASAPELP